MFHLYVLKFLIAFRKDQPFETPDRILQLNQILSFQYRCLVIRLERILHQDGSIDREVHDNMVDLGKHDRSHFKFHSTIINGKIPRYDNKIFGMRNVIQVISLRTI